MVLKVIRRKMTRQELEHLGNVKAGFENPTRYVRPIGFLITPKLILKKYDMYTNITSSGYAVRSMEKFLESEINNNKIDPKLGLGFSILSKDMLNVVRWDNKYPIIAVNNLYEFSEKERDSMKPTPLSVDNAGAYCVWELGILDHERRAWMEYLSSKGTYEDKQKYLYNFLRGSLKVKAEVEK